MKKLILVTALALGSVASGQTTPSATPTTDLENFISQSGVITLRESLGSQAYPSNLNASVATLEAVRISRPSSKQQILGVGFNISTDRGSKTIFIDYSEMQGLIDALAYIAKNSATLNSQLQPELSFTSKAGLRIGVLNSPTNGLTGFVSTGTLTVFENAINIGAIHDTLVKFQAVLK